LEASGITCSQSVVRINGIHPMRELSQKIFRNLDTISVVTPCSTRHCSGGTASRGGVM